MSRLLCALAILLMPLQVYAAVNNSSPGIYHLGIFPYMAPRQTVEFYGPVAISMGTVLKHSVRLESMPNFPAFKLAMSKRQFDIALIQPFDYPEVVEKLGYLPVAQFAKPLLTQFFVRNDSQYKTIADLRGSIVAMPPEQAANTRMALRALYDNKLIPGTNVIVRYFKSHDSCIQQVWAGSASACGTALPPVLVFEQRMQAKLRTIYDTPPIPHIMFVASPHIPARQRAKLKKLITGWSNTVDGRSILKNLGFPGFVVPKPAEYAMMRNYDPAAILKQTANIKKKEKKELILGVFPFLSTRLLAENFAPTLPALGKAVGRPIILQTASNFDNFSTNISTANYDIVIVQPYDYAKAVNNGYVPLAAMKNMLEGTFFVLENSSYKQIADLKGQTIAMPPKNSVQSHLGRSALLQAGLKPGSDVYIDYRNTHDSCLMQVEHGVAAACVTSELTLSMLPKELSQGLHNIGKTEKHPGVLFMAHKRLSLNIRKQLEHDIIAWKDTDEGQKILQSMGLGDFIRVETRLYRHLH